jgi:hypothetical protein
MAVRLIQRRVMALFGQSAYQAPTCSTSHSEKEPRAFSSIYHEAVGVTPLSNAAFQKMHAPEWSPTLF